MNDLKLFYSNTNTEDRFTEESLLNKCAFVIYEKGHLSISELFNEIKKDYPGIPINYTAFTEFIKLHFRSYDVPENTTKKASDEFNVFFSLSNTDEIYTKTNLLRECVDIASESKSITLQDLADKIQKTFGCKINSSGFKKFIKEYFELKKYSVVSIKEKAYQDCGDEVSGLWKENRKTKIADLINAIDSDNYSYPVRDVFGDLASSLNSASVYLVEDLLSQDIDTILVAVGSSYFDFVSTLKGLQNSYYQSCTKTVFDLIGSQLSERHYTILLERNGYFSSKGKTLEEVSLQFDLTRERIRQIEKKGTTILKEISQQCSKEISFINTRLFNEKPFLSVEEIKNILGEKDAYYYLFLIISGNGDLKYDANYHIVLASDKDSFQNYKTDVLSSYGPTIQPSIYEKLPDIEKRILSEQYIYSQRMNLYKQNAVRLTDIAEEIIRDYFPEGYRIYSEDKDFVKFSDIYARKYGLEAEPITATSLRGMTYNSVFCQYDKGKVISRKNAITLPDELIERMLHFIAQYDEVIYYATIFEKFKDELKSYGVNNRYYMKGLIDPELPEKYRTKRDYISLGDDFVSSYESIKKEIESFSGSFTIEDLLAKHPGLKDYVFLNMLYGREDLVWLSGRKWILLKNLDLSKPLVKTIEAEIEYLFEYLKTQIISSGKIYSRMKIMHEELMNKIPEIDSKYAFISLVSVLLGEKYNVVRQYITKKDNNEDITAYSLIEDFVKDKDSFNLEDIKNYTEKMNIRGLYSYQEFMIDESDEFVQINIDTCVNKKVIDINDDVVLRIKKELDFYIDSFGPLMTWQFNGYGNLPTIPKYKWNKYLLVGIIRAYLNEYYQIEYTDNVSTKTDYIIRRQK